MNKITHCPNKHIYSCKNTNNEINVQVNKINNNRKISNCKNEPIHVWRLAQNVDAYQATSHVSVKNLHSFTKITHIFTLP